MLKTKISDDERYALQQYNRTTKLELIRLKCFSVLIANQGLSSTAISEIVGKSIRTVNRWLKDWDERHLASIFSGHQDNSNASKLTKPQLQQIKEVLSQPPSEYGIPKEFWTCQRSRTTYQRRLASYTNHQSHTTSSSAFQDSVLSIPIPSIPNEMNCSSQREWKSYRSGACSAAC